MASIVLANERFYTAIGKDTFDVFAGDAFEADHPLVKKNPHLFHDPELRYPTRKAAEPKPHKATEAEERAFGFDGFGDAEEAAAPKPRKSIRRKARKATPAEETAIAETVEAETEPEPEHKPSGLSNTALRR